MIVYALMFAALGAEAVPVAFYPTDEACKAVLHSVVTTASAFGGRMGCWRTVEDILQERQGIEDMKKRF